MATRRQLLDEGRRQLTESGVPSPGKELEWLLMEAEECSRTDLIVNPDSEVVVVAEKRFRNFVDRRSRREPVQYILGYTEFFGLRFSVSPDVLIPRPETETLVEYALEFIQTVSRPRIVDIGTGSGCIAIAIFDRVLEARITGIDRDENALEIARKNSALIRADIEWLKEDLHNPDLARRIGTDIDLLISNPPYIPAVERSTLDPEVRLYEPSSALFPGEDHLSAFRSIGRLATEVLTPRGALFTEVHELWAEETVETYEGVGLEKVSILKDLAGKNRVVSARARREA